jgi:hypothetical protein
VLSVAQLQVRLIAGAITLLNEWAALDNISIDHEGGWSH